MNYIICYDIENSVVYDLISDENLPLKKKTDEEVIAIRKDHDAVREYVCRAIGQTDTKAIYAENLEKAQAIVDTININTPVKDKLVLVPFTHKYLSNYYIYCVEEDKFYTFFTTTIEDEVDKITNIIIPLWEQGNNIVFTAHNIDYEYRYIRTNLPILFDLLCEKCNNNYKIIAAKTTDIKSFTFTIVKDEQEYQFTFRDTYLMTNRSIADLGKIYDLEKNNGKGKYDYIKTRITANDLVDNDYEYNKRDNEIAMAYLLDLRKKYSWYDDITKLPVSLTQTYKEICKHDETINKKVEYTTKTGKKRKQELYQKHKQLAKLFNMPNMYLHQQFFNASGGGFVGVNPLLSGGRTTNQIMNLWFDNCHSFDIKSAHPSQIFARRYPMGKNTKKIQSKLYKWYLDYYKKLAKQLVENPKEFYNTFNPALDTLLKVELYNVKEKKLPNNNCINLLGVGNVTIDDTDFIAKMNDEKFSCTRQALRLDDLGKERDANNVYRKNGKVRKCTRYIKWFYGIDLISILTFYDCEVRILEGYVYNLTAVDDYLLNKFVRYAKLKEGHKKIKNLADTLPYDELYEEIVKCIDEGIVDETTKLTIEGHKNDYKDFLEQELLRVKGIFNGIFGQEYQNPVHNPVDFDEYYGIQKTGEAPDYQECIKNTNCHYCVGAYIAGWTRLELTTMIWHCINHGGTVLYFATDSIKCFGVDDTLFDNWYDELRENSKYGKYNEWGFGGVDCETKGHPQSMYVLETLKYVAITYDTDKEVLEKYGKRCKLKATISGFNKDKYLEPIVNKYCVIKKDSKIVSAGLEYNEENVNNMKKELAELLKPQIIPPEKTNKIAPDYSNVGVLTPYGQRDFGALLPMEYNLLHYFEES